MFETAVTVVVFVAQRGVEAVFQAEEGHLVNTMLEEGVIIVCSVHDSSKLWRPRSSNR